MLPQSWPFLFALPGTTEGLSLLSLSYDQVCHSCDHAPAGSEKFRSGPLNSRGQVGYIRARCIMLSNKIAQKPLALLGDWSVTVGALSASFGH
jgi:hypothetical protein